MQKVDSIPLFFLEILQRYCRLINLSTLSMPGYGRQKRLDQLVEKFDFYLHAKSHIYLS